MREREREELRTDTRHRNNDAVIINYAKEKRTTNNEFAMKQACVVKNQLNHDLKKLVRCRRLKLNRPSLN